MSMSQSKHYFHKLMNNASSPDIRELAKGLYYLAEELEQKLRDVEVEAHRAASRSGRA